MIFDETLLETLSLNEKENIAPNQAIDLATFSLTGASLQLPKSRQPVVKRRHTSRSIFSPARDPKVPSQSVADEKDENTILGTLRNMNAKSCS